MPVSEKPRKYAQNHDVAGWQPGSAGGDEMVRAALATACAVLLAAACGGNSPSPVPGGTAEADSGLASTLQVRVSGDTVRFDLYVTNSTGSAVELEFPSSQRFDFAVETEGGERLWTWSAARSFAQVTGTETLAAGQTLQHAAEWVADGGRSGRFVAVGWLTTSTPRVERRSYFELP